MHHIAEETDLSVLLKVIDESLRGKRVDPMSPDSHSHTFFMLHAVLWGFSNCT